MEHPDSIRNDTDSKTCNFIKILIYPFLNIESVQVGHEANKG